MKRKLAALLAAVSLLSAGSAFALVKTNSMNVNMSVYTPTTCTISAGGVMDFGTYVTNNNFGNLANTIVNVTCTSNRNFLLYPDDGLHPIAGNRRVFRAGTDYIPYVLYSNVALPQSYWDSNNKMSGVGTGVSQTYVVYGNLYGGQLVSTGAADGIYNDTVTMTVEYTP